MFETLCGSHRVSLLFVVKVNQGPKERERRLQNVMGLNVDGNNE